MLQHDYLYIIEHIRGYDDAVVLLAEELYGAFDHVVKDILSYYGVDYEVVKSPNLLNDLVDYMYLGYDIEASFLKPSTLSFLLLYLLYKVDKIPRNICIYVGRFKLDHKLLVFINRFSQAKNKYRVYRFICRDIRSLNDLRYYAGVSERSIYRYLAEYEDLGLIRYKHGRIQLTPRGNMLCTLIDLLWRTRDKQYESKN